MKKFFVFITALIAVVGGIFAFFAFLSRKNAPDEDEE